MNSSNTMRSVSPSGGKAPPGAVRMKGPPGAFVPGSKKMMVPPPGASTSFLGGSMNPAGGSPGRSVSVKGMPATMSGKKMMMVPPGAKGPMPPPLGSGFQRPPPPSNPNAASLSASLGPGRPGMSMGPTGNASMSYVNSPGRSSRSMSPAGGAPGGRVPANALRPASPQGTSDMGSQKRMVPMPGVKMPPGQVPGKKMPAPPFGSILVHKGAPGTAAATASASSLHPGFATSSAPSVSGQSSAMRGASPVSSRPVSPQSFVGSGRRSPSPGSRSVVRPVASPGGSSIRGGNPSKLPPGMLMGKGNALLGSPSASPSAKGAASPGGRVLAQGPAPSASAAPVAQGPQRGGRSQSLSLAGGHMPLPGGRQSPSGMSSSGLGQPDDSPSGRRNGNASHRFAPFRLLRAGTDSDSDDNGNTNGNSGMPAPSPRRAASPPMSLVSGKKMVPSRSGSPSSFVGSGSPSSAAPHPPFQMLNGKKVMVMGKGGGMPLPGTKLPPGAIPMPAGMAPPAMMGMKKIMVPPPSSASGRASPVLGMSLSGGGMTSSMHVDPAAPSPMSVKVAPHAPGQGLPKGVKWMPGKGAAAPPGAAPMPSMSQSPSPLAETQRGNSQGKAVMRVPGATVLREDAPEVGVAKPDKPKNAVKRAKKTKKAKPGAGTGRFGALMLDDSDEDSEEEDADEEEEEELEEEQEGDVVADPAVQPDAEGGEEDDGGEPQAPGYDPDRRPGSPPLPSQPTESFGYGQGPAPPAASASAASPFLQGLSTGEGTLLDDEHKTGNSNGAVGENHSDGGQTHDDAQSKQSDEAPSPAPKDPRTRPTAPPSPTQSAGKQKKGDQNSARPHETLKEKASQKPRVPRPPPNTASSGRAKALKEEEATRAEQARKKEEEQRARTRRNSLLARRRTSSMASSARSDASSGTQERVKPKTGKSASRPRASSSAGAHKHSGRSPRAASLSTLTGRMSSATGSASEAEGSRNASRTGSVDSQKKAAKRKPSDEGRETKSRPRRHGRSRSESSGASQRKPSSGKSASSSVTSSPSSGSRSHHRRHHRHASPAFDGVKTSDLYRLYNLLRTGDVANGKDDGSHGGRRSATPQRRRGDKTRHHGGLTSDDDEHDARGESWLRRRRDGTPRGRSPFSTSPKGRHPPYGSRSHERDRSTGTIGSPAIPWRYSKKNLAGEPFDPPTPLQRPLGYINTGGGRYAAVGGGSPYARSPRRSNASSARQRLPHPRGALLHDTTLSSSSMPPGSVAAANGLLHSPKRGRARDAEELNAARARDIVGAVQSDPLPLHSPSRGSPRRDTNASLLSTSAGESPEAAHPYCVSKPPPYMRLSKGKAPFDYLASPDKDLGATPGAGTSLSNGTAAGKEKNAEPSLLREAGRALDAYLRQKQELARGRRDGSTSPTPSGGGHLPRTAEDGPSFFDQLYATQHTHAATGESKLDGALNTPTNSPRTSSRGQDRRLVSPLRHSADTTSRPSREQQQSRAISGSGSVIREACTPLLVGSVDDPDGGPCFRHPGDSADSRGTLSARGPSPSVPSAVEVLSRDRLAERHHPTDDPAAPSADSLLRGVPPALPPDPLTTSTAQGTDPRVTSAASQRIPRYAQPRASSALQSRRSSPPGGRRTSGHALLSPPRPSSQQRARSSSAPKAFTKATANRLSRPAHVAVPITGLSSGGGGGGGRRDGNVPLVPGVAAEKRMETKKWLDEVLSSIAAAPQASAGVKPTGQRTRTSADGHTILVPAPGTESPPPPLSAGGDESAESPAGKKIPIPLVDYRKDFRPLTANGHDGTPRPHLLRQLDAASKAIAPPEGPRRHVQTIDFSRMQGARSPAAPTSPARSSKGFKDTTLNTSPRKEVPLHVGAPADGLPFEAYSTIKVKDPQMPSAWARAPPRDGFDFLPGKPVVRKVVSARSAAGSHMGAGSEPANDHDSSHASGRPEVRLVQEVWLDEHKQPYIKIREIPCGEAAKAQRLAMERLSKPRPIFVRADEVERPTV